MAIGVVAALDEVGLAGTVPVSGQDGDDPALNRVAMGPQMVSVWKDAFGLGETAGEVAVQLAKAPPSRTSSPRRSPGPRGARGNLKAPPIHHARRPRGPVDHPEADPDQQSNLKLVVDLGWITTDVLCAGVSAGPVEVSACTRTESRPCALRRVASAQGARVRPIREWAHDPGL